MCVVLASRERKEPERAVECRHELERLDNQLDDAAPNTKTQGWQLPTQAWQLPTHGWQLPTHGWQLPTNAASCQPNTTDAKQPQGMYSHHVLHSTTTYIQHHGTTAYVQHCATTACTPTQELRRTAGFNMMNPVLIAMPSQLLKMPVSSKHGSDRNGTDTA